MYGFQWLDDAWWDTLLSEFDGLVEVCVWVREDGGVWTSNLVFLQNLASCTRKVLGFLKIFNLQKQSN